MMQKMRFMIGSGNDHDFMNQVVMSQSYATLSCLPATNRIKRVALNEIS